MTINRVYPQQFISVDSERTGFITALGPPDDLTGTCLYGPAHLRRIPCIYRQDSVLTSPMEKIVCSLLTAVYQVQQLPHGPLLLAWADLNPLVGARVGDAWELIEADYIEALDPNAIAPRVVRESWA